ncbi:hypothetical protein [Sporocytophaga sp.]|nr:hypothetical protein [Sporocytophaga sp.]
MKNPRNFLLNYSIESKWINGWTGLAILGISLIEVERLKLL